MFTRNGPVTHEKYGFCLARRQFCVESWQFSLSARKKHTIVSTNFLGAVKIFWKFAKFFCSRRALRALRLRKKTLQIFKKFSVEESQGFGMEVGTYGKTLRFLSHVLSKFLPRVTSYARPSPRMGPLRARSAKFVVGCTTGRNVTRVKRIIWCFLH